MRSKPVSLYGVKQRDKKLDTVEAIAHNKDINRTVTIMSLSPATKPLAAILADVVKRDSSIVFFLATSVYVQPDDLGEIRLDSPAALSEHGNSVPDGYLRLCSVADVFTWQHNNGDWMQTLIDERKVLMSVRMDLEFIQGIDDYSF